MAKQLYEVDYNGTVYEVEADSPEQAAAAFAKKEAPTPTAATEPTPTGKGAGFLGSLDPLSMRVLTSIAGAPTTKDAVGGAADVTATAVTGGIGSTVGGVLGLTMGAGTKSMDVANKTYEQAQSALTWSPKTEAGRRILTEAGDAIEPVMTKMRDVFSWVSRESPAVATILETLVLGGPEILAGQRLGVGAAARRRLGPLLESRLKNAADRLGIDLNNNTVRPSTIAAAERLTGGARSRAETGIEDIVPEVIKKEQASRKNVNQLYTEARSTSAVMNYEPIAKATDEAFESLRQRGFDIEQSPHLKARIQELLDLDSRIPGIPGKAGERPGAVVPGTPASSVLGPDSKPLVAATGSTKKPVSIPLNDVELINQRITQSISTVGKNTPEGVALIKLRRNVNEMIDDQFTRDMISGDPTARAKWNAAKAANTEHKNRFHSDKVIGTIVKGDLSAQQTARLILGASETKHALGAVKTVKKLKAILGEDAPELDAIRTSVMVDLFDPMFKETPNWKAVGERIRQVEKNSPMLLDELGISKNDLDILRRAANAAAKAVEQGDLDMRGFIASSIGRLTVGHEIAKAAVHVKLVNMFADRLLGVGQKTHKQLLREFTGDELASNPLIANANPSKRGLIANAAIIAELQAAGENPEDR